MIELRGLTRHYHMGDNVVRALDGVDLTIERGTFVTIVGSSGSGKSTLMNILGCLDQPSSGSYRLAGEPMESYDEARLSDLRNRRIGFVFQQFHLLHHLTVRENIELPLAYRGLELEERQRRSRAVAERLQMVSRLDHRPFELSGGQAQRVAIMRALSGDPDILLLDEPTGALDSRTGRQIMDAFHELHQQGLTVIMVTHDRDLAEEGERVIELADGRVVADRPGRGPSRQGELPPIAEGKSHVGGLPLRELLRMGIREGLLVHKTRSLLTMLGVIIGVAAVIAMSSFSLGSKQKQADQIRALGSNLIRVVDRQLENEALVQARVAGSRGLSQQDADMLKQQVSGIHRMALQRALKARISHQGRDLDGQILGVAGDFLAVNKLQLATGRPLEPLDQVQVNRVAVIGAQLGSSLGGNQSALGQTIRIGRDPYQVVGVLAPRHVDARSLEASGAADQNRSVLLPLSCVQYRTVNANLRSPLDEIHMEIASEDQLFEAGLHIKRLIGAAHQGVDDTSVVIPLDLLKQQQQSARLLDVLTLCIASISLVVGGIGIMNIMLAAVTERMKEIGIRRAIGATASDIRRQFLTEATILSVTGGLLGVILALFLVFVVGALIDIPPVFSLGMITLAVSAAVGTGLLFGWWPARQASRKNPVEVLRNE